MPQQQKQQKKKSPVEPSRGLLERIFGSSPMTPEIEEGLNIARKEMPDLANVETYGPISKLLLSDAKGYVSPGGSIYLNPDQLRGHSPEEVADTLTHEQEHINQMRQRGGNVVTETLRNSLIGRMFNDGYEPYHRRPDEMGAFTAERERRARDGRGQTAIPSFLTGDYYVPEDIRLRDRVGPSIEERQRLLLTGGRKR